MIDTQTTTKPSNIRLAYIGGGNMARAMIGGWLRAQAGQATDGAGSVVVVEPHAPTREALAADFNVTTFADAADPACQAALRASQVVVWAVKPQVFAEAAAPLRGCVDQALQVSIMAGVRLGAVLRASGATAAVRCMPNTPALIGQGITGLYASPAVSAAQRAQVEQILGTTGQWVWMREEAQLDAVTALSGSGPAYVFYVLEALIGGGVKLGLDEADAKKLALATLSGATSLAAQSSEPPSVLRERVTSKGGTTYAALQVLRERGVSDAIEAALKAAVLRAQALGDELGA